MTIGKSILKFRTDKGLTQKEFSDMCGFSQSALNLWENEKRNPKIEQLRKIATVFQCNILDVVEYDTGITDETDPETVELLKLNAEVTQILKKYGSCKTLSKEDEQKLIEYNSRVQREYEQEQREEAAKKAPKFIAYDEKGNKIEATDGKPPKFTDSSMSKEEAIAEAEAEELERLQTAYKRLNRKGKTKAVERVEELTEISRYTKEDPPIDPFFMLSKKKRKR